MPSPETFSIPPIKEFVKRYLNTSTCSIDPFARNRRWATYTNDLNPNTAAEYHMDAVAFLEKLASDGVTADLIIFDPPYSPRQISECYAEVGLKATMEDTQSAAFYAAMRDSAMKLIRPNGTVLSFGWNSVGMGGG